MPVTADEQGWMLPHALVCDPCCAVLCCVAHLHPCVALFAVDSEIVALFAVDFVAEGVGMYVQTTLRGHRSVGGMRASIYNAMPVEGCETLVAFMKEFQAKHS